jgi:hypothetical protein
MRMKRSPLVITAALGLAIAGGSAFTASNTVAATSAGQGAQTITGFAVSSVEYTRGAVNASTEDEVATARFRLTAAVPANGAATFARARLRGANTAAATNYVACAVDAGATTTLATQGANIWNCTFPAGVKAVDVDSLQVVAVQ